MARLLPCFLLTCLLGTSWAAPGAAQAPSAAPPDTAAADSARTDSAHTVRPPKKEPRIYFGGSLGLNVFGSQVYVSLQPYVGYKLTRKLSLGARLGYEYWRDNRFDQNINSHNYGGGIFSRYRLLRQAYAQTELAFMSYDWTDERDFVPFLLVGGGYVEPLGPRLSLMVEVMYDLLQDEGSPYKDWEPRVTVGMGANF